MQKFRRNPVRDYLAKRHDGGLLKVEFLLVWWKKWFDFITISEPQRMKYVVPIFLLNITLKTLVNERESIPEGPKDALSGKFPMEHASIFLRRRCTIKEKLRNGMKKNASSHGGRWVHTPHPPPRFDPMHESSCYRIGWDGNFRKSANQPIQMALTICDSISCNCFRLMSDWKLGSFPNGKEISVVPFRKGKEDYLWRKSKVSERIFRKITVPFDFQPKHRIFLLNCKHPLSTGYC